MKEEYYLVGDIGGTNITLGIAKFNSNTHKIIFKKNYLTKDFNGLCEVTTKFLNEISNLNLSTTKIIVENAVFGVASEMPESFDVIFHLTNSPFVIERNRLIETTSIKNATYINDFESLGYSVLDINANKLLKINEGISKKLNYPTITVIGAGTGLGKVKLVYDSTLKKYVDIPSESGHMSLTIEGEEELRLTRFILKKCGLEEVEFEDILSGRGIENIYAFITRKDFSAKQISFLKNNDDENAKRTFEIFYRFYARFANIMVQMDSSNIIYLVGGIIAKNINFSKEDFMSEFLKNNKTNNKQDLKDTSIYAVIDYDISLNGVCKYIELNLLDK